MLFPLADSGILDALFSLAYRQTTLPPGGGWETRAENAVQGEPEVLFGLSYEGFAVGGMKNPGKSSGRRGSSSGETARPGGPTGEQAAALVHPPPPSRPYLFGLAIGSIAGG